MLILIALLAWTLASCGGALALGALIGRSHAEPEVAARVPLGSAA